MMKKEFILVEGVDVFFGCMDDHIWDCGYLPFKESQGNNPTYT